MKNQTVKTLKIGSLKCKYDYIDNMIKAGNNTCNYCDGYGDMPNGVRLDWWLRRYVEKTIPCRLCNGTGFEADVCFKQWTGKRTVDHG